LSIIFSLVSLFLVFTTGFAAAKDVIRVRVIDALGRPLSKISLTLRLPNGHVNRQAYTDADGEATIGVTEAGVYDLAATGADFRPASKILVWPSASRSLEIVLEAREALNVPVKAGRLRPQNGLSSNGNSKYTMTARDIGNLPMGEAAPLNDVLLQMPGVALDQNQEIHIRGEHAGVQYQVDDILLPLDINNDPTFTQLLNSYFVDGMSLIDGALPAQYGYRTAGVVEIKTKTGCDSGHNSLTLLGGMYDTAEPSFELQQCGSGYSYYLTGVFTRTSLGLSSATAGHDPIHDVMNQGQSFGYFEDQVTPALKLSLLGGLTLAYNQFPNRPDMPALYRLKGVNPTAYPSTAIDSTLDQQDYWAALALNGIASDRLAYQVAYAAHYNAQSFNPDYIGDLIYQGISPQVFTSDLANTLQGGVTYHLEGHEIQTGFYFGEYGVESDNTSEVFPVNTKGVQIPPYVPFPIISNLNKINFLYGLYIQDAWQITPRLSINFGSRWDRADGFVNDSQFSPTINFVFRALPGTTLHAGFARNFQVPNFQMIAVPGSGLKGTSGGVGLPATIKLDAETDYIWDAGYIHKFTPHLQLSQDSYFRIDRHYIDEGQFGDIPLDAPFNYVRGYGAGIENSVTYNLDKLSLRANAFVAREEVRGVATGQYNFPPLGQLQYIDDHYIILDHTPLLGMSGGMAYRWREYRFMLDGLYSSGLRGGFANTDQLPVVWQIDLSALREFDLPGVGEVEDRLTLINIFDRTNLIRPPSGVGVLQSAYGPRISLYNAITLPLPVL
jgi:TonB dependent receptor-like, beta-barrel/Carboxypeptidase regulatory-like domain